MASSLDQFLPKTHLNFPNGAVLTIGSVASDGPTLQVVYVGFTPADSATPSMELEIPPHAVEVIMQQLQHYANQVRFINGVPMLEYPAPHPISSPSDARAKRRTPRKKPTKGQQ